MSGNQRPPSLTSVPTLSHCFSHTFLSGKASHTGHCAPRDPPPLTPELQRLARTTSARERRVRVILRRSVHRRPQGKYCTESAQRPGGRGLKPYMTPIQTKKHKTNNQKNTPLEKTENPKQESKKAKCNNVIIINKKQYKTKQTKKNKIRNEQ